MRIGRLWRLLPLWAALSATAQTGDPLAAARAELANGRATAALERLEPLEDERAGDPDFDYLLGVAALEAGQASRASLVFERVLAIRPEHAGARIDLGRAYFAMGAHGRARDEFAVARALDPPPDALKTIEAHEAAMNERTPGERRFVAWAEAMMGRDSNVNQATSATSIYLPVFQGSFTLTGDGRERADSYRAANLGARYAHPVGGGFALLAGGELKARRHNEAASYDNSNLDGHLGARWGGETQAAQILASHGSYRLDGESYRKTTAVSADWRRTFGDAGALDVFGQFYRIRYAEDDLSSNDVNLTIAGAGWMRTNGDGQWFAALFGGRERAIAGRADGDRTLAGIRAGFQRRLAGAFEAGAALSAQAGRYADENPLFLDRRRDRQYDLSLTAAWAMTPAWSLRLNAVLTRNDSNFAIYDYNRRDVSFGVRYDFR